jgi:hypothetical protein
VFILLAVCEPGALQREHLSIYNEPCCELRFCDKTRKRVGRMWNNFASGGVAKKKEKKTESTLSQNANILSNVCLTWLLSLTRFTFLVGHHSKFLKSTSLPPPRLHIASVLFFLKH